MGQKSTTRSPKSAQRESLAGLLASTITALRGMRVRLATLTADVDAALEGAKTAQRALADLDSDADDGAARARLRVFGYKGKLVVLAAQSHSADLRDVLGPGAPRTPEGGVARRAAIVGLLSAGVSAADAARVLGVTYEVARVIRAEMAADTADTGKAAA